MSAWQRFVDASFPPAPDDDIRTMLRRRLLEGRPLRRSRFERKRRPKCECIGLSLYHEEICPRSGIDPPEPDYAAWHEGWAPAAWEGRSHAKEEPDILTITDGWGNPTDVVEVKPRRARPYVPPVD